MLRVPHIACDASALNLVVAGASKEDQAVFCDISRATATTDLHTVHTVPNKLSRKSGNRIQKPN